MNGDPDEFIEQLKQKGISFQVNSPKRSTRKKSIAKDGIELSFESNGSLYIWRIPVELVSEANQREHWAKASNRHAKQRKAVFHAFSNRLFRLYLIKNSIAENKVVRCQLVRIGGRFIDKDDNLPDAFKWIKDAICLYLGIDDGKGCPIVWSYDQTASKLIGIEVRFSIEDC